MNEFYKDKKVVSKEWWLDECAFPGQCWARVRKFTDGSCDVRFDVKDEDKCYGFNSLESARLFLLEDEFTSYENFCAEDEIEHGVKKAELQLPTWFPGESKELEYVGQY